MPRDLEEVPARRISFFFEFTATKLQTHTTNGAPNGYASSLRQIHVSTFVAGHRNQVLAAFEDLTTPKHTAVNSLVDNMSATGVQAFRGVEDADSVVLFPLGAVEPFGVLVKTTVHKPSVDSFIRLPCIITNGRGSLHHPTTSRTHTWVLKRLLVLVKSELLKSSVLRTNFLS